MICERLSRSTGGAPRITEGAHRGASRFRSSHAATISSSRSFSVSQLAARVLSAGPAHSPELAGPAAASAAEVGSGTAPAATPPQPSSTASNSTIAAWLPLCTSMIAWPPSTWWSPWAAVHHVPAARMSAGISGVLSKRGSGEPGPVPLGGEAGTESIHEPIPFVRWSLSTLV
jgi:hypothetical protein